MKIAHRIFRIVRFNLFEFRDRPGERSGSSARECDSSPHRDPPNRDSTGSGFSGSGLSGQYPEEGPQDARLAGYYANLEIPYGAALVEVRTAWKRLMKVYHPDLHSADPERRNIANEITAQLTEAYRQLEEASGQSSIGE